jgi:ORF6N domain
MAKRKRALRSARRTPRRRSPRTQVEAAIRSVRGERVVLDVDLAELYGVSTRALVQATKRNASRFPSDFMFQLTPQEAKHLRSQNVISSARGGHGGRRYRPFVFTEQGVAMLSSVLRSHHAAIVNVAIMRAFVRLRQIFATHDDLAARIDELEHRYDAQFTNVFDMVRRLLRAPAPPARIGFRPTKADATPASTRVL